MHSRLFRLVALFFCGGIACDVPAHVYSQDGPKETAIELPRPSGSLPIGRTAFHCIDESRSPPGSASRGAKRELMAYVWYPSEKHAGDAPAPYVPDYAALIDVVGEANLRRETGAAFAALSTARTHCVANAEVKSDAPAFPVLLLSHGLGFNAIGYSVLCEDLASHGYVVVGVDHPSTALVVLYPDKRTVPFAVLSWNQRRTSEDSLAFERKSNNDCAADLRFVLNHLEKLQRGDLPSPFKGRLDLNRVGVLGHSTVGSRRRSVSTGWRARRTSTRPPTAAPSSSRS
jgi:predicted dienelactone hydrolase